MRPRRISHHADLAEGKGEWRSRIRAARRHAVLEELDVQLYHDIGVTLIQGRLLSEPDLDFVRLISPVNGRQGISRASPATAR